MKLIKLTLRALAGMIFSVLALLHNNLLSQTPTTFALSDTPIRGADVAGLSDLLRAVFHSPREPTGVDRGNHQSSP